MPVSARDYVMGKFLVNAVFGLTGVTAGAVIGVVGGTLLRRLDLLVLLGCIVAGILFNLLSGTLFIQMCIRDRVNDECGVRKNKEDWIWLDFSGRRSVRGSASCIKYCFQNGAVSG